MLRPELLASWLPLLLAKLLFGFSDRFSVAITGALNSPTLAGEALDRFSLAISFVSITGALNSPILAEDETLGWPTFAICSVLIASLLNWLTLAEEEALLTVEPIGFGAFSNV